jgi:phage/plasmid-like protein (TIGR03299 family)
MAHMIETFAYTGEKPWHKLGVAVDPWLTAEEMMKAAKLDWTVSKRDIFLENGKKIPDQYAIVRDSDETILSMSGEKFKVMQNHEGFEFFSEFVKAGNMTMETAGSLAGGKSIFALAKMNQNDFYVANKNDNVENYMLITIPHEYGKSIYIMYTPIRVVCNNTLQFALDARGADGVFRMTHGRQWSERVAEEARMTLNLTASKVTEYKESGEFLASKKITDNNLKQYFAELFQPDLKNVANGEDWNRVMKKMVGEVYENQPGFEMGAGTHWAAFNAVTFYVDHVAGRSDDTRVKSAIVGVGSALKRKALGLAMDYANAA